MATTYIALYIRPTTGQALAIKTYSRKEYAVRAADKFAEETYVKAQVVTSGGKVVHTVDRTRQAAEVTVVLAGRVAKALGVTGVEAPAKGKGTQVTATLYRRQARTLLSQVKAAGFRDTTTARHVGRIEAALAA